jgi:transposase
LRRTFCAKPTGPSDAPCAALEAGGLEAGGPVRATFADAIIESREVISMRSDMSGYPSDLSDTQWETIRRCIPPSRPVGVSRQVSIRAVINAVRYRQRTGCPWRLLPHDFPHWRTVYGYYRQWQADGTWRRIENSQRALRRQTAPPVRSANPRREPNPTGQCR